MSASEQQVRDLIAEQAADWFVENRGGLDGDQRRAFTEWLKSSPVHVEEYLAFCALAQDLPAASELDETQLEALVSRARQEEVSSVHALRPRNRPAQPEVRARRSPVLALAASLLALAVGLLAVWYVRTALQPPQSADAGVLHFRTRHGEQQTQRLADQSVVHLNTDTAVTVRFDGRQRLVVVESGEADFEVAHEVARDFRVSAGAAEVIAVGTRFDVRLGEASTLVTVSQGRVKIGLTSNANPTLEYLSAGQQLTVADTAWPARPVGVDALRATAWLNRQIKFDNEPLQHVTSEFNRYAPTPFEITTPALQELKISGVFATDDSDAFIAFLRSLQGVRVEVGPSRIQVSQR